jgi:adenylyltransferase/sulfurtransferase
VDWSNLQRQCLFTEQDARDGWPKAEAARRRLTAVNSAIRIEGVVADVTARNAERVLLADRATTERFVLVDGTDNFEVRFLLNDVAVKHSLPLAYAGVVGMAGTSMTVVPGKTACLRCLGEKPAAGSVETCETAGVFGPAIGAIAAFQAAEVLRLLAHGAGNVGRTLVALDVWRRTSRAIDTAALGPRPECVCCGQRRFEYLDSKRGGDEAALCGQDAVHVSAGEERQINLASLAARWLGLGVVTCNPLLARLAFAAEARAREITVFADGRAIVKGTTKPEVARAIYARYVGV